MIKAKGIERGLVDHKHSNVDEIVDLILQPGFSTSVSVSDISGRGVGMDAVVAHLEAIGGDLQIDITEQPQNEFVPVKFVLSIPENNNEWFVRAG